MRDEYKNKEVYVTDHALRITDHAARITDTMSEIVNQSLQKIAKGTGIIFIGTIIGMLLGFIGRIILIRYTTQTEYIIPSNSIQIFISAHIKQIMGEEDGYSRD
jgi:tetrahydromethanopterin S-methyltransferase subunit G